MKLARRRCARCGARRYMRNLHGTRKHMHYGTLVYVCNDEKKCTARAQVRYTLYAQG